MADPHSSE